ncbi:hypothetical protein ACFQZQ_02920 [Lysobacter koreensis]|uniref:Uncharacterized protein n=1 Tax=Lysobacter koreensis TaxID=266122 RepID=A0ABW2YJF8_9GAMM
MTDKTEHEILRGHDAELLLSHPLLTDAFQIIEQELTEQWQNSPARDQEGREKLWVSLKLLKRLQGQLTSVVETGQFAKATLAQRVGQRLSQSF